MYHDFIKWFARIRPGHFERLEISLADGCPRVKAIIIRSCPWPFCCPGLKRSKFLSPTSSKSYAYLLPPSRSLSFWGKQSFATYVQVPSDPWKHPRGAVILALGDEINHTTMAVTERGIRCFWQIEEIYERTLIFQQ